jgi:hypothetical protein
VKSIKFPDSLEEREWIFTVIIGAIRVKVIFVELDVIWASSQRIPKNGYV